LTGELTLDWKEFRADDVMTMAAEAGIPEADRQPVVAHARKEFDSLHEGNIVRYRLKLADLEAIRRRPGT
jgi:hypothetical protein